MELNITEAAVQRLNELNKDEMNYLLLWYDRDDCGCGVNGVPTIRFVNETNDHYKEVQNDLFPTLISKQQSVFFNIEMKLDYFNGCFKLSSPEQMLNPFIPENSVCSIETG